MAEKHTGTISTKFYDEILAPAGLVVERPKAEAADRWTDEALHDVPVFPLPQVVLFPRALLPLHISVNVLGYAAFTLAFAVAASANFPCVLLTLYWKRCTTGCAAGRSSPRTSTS